MAELPHDPKPWTWSVTDPELAGRAGAKLMAHILSVLGDLFLKKSDEEDGGSRATH